MRSTQTVPTSLTQVPQAALALPVPDMPSLEDWLYVMEEEERQSLSGGDDYLDQVVLPPPRIDTTRLAERHVHYLQRLQRELDAVHAQAAERRAQIDAWERRRTQRLERSVAWNEAGLMAYLTSLNTKTVELVNGLVRRQKGREKVEITDLETFLETAPGELVRTKQEPDKKAILAHYKSTGEIVDGTEIVTGEPTLSVAFADAPAARSTDADAIAAG